MPVNSYLELVLSTFGWLLYDLLWSILVDTGLAYIPILSVIIKNITDPITSQEARGAATTSLRRLEIDVIRITIVLFLAVAPFFTIGNASQTLTSACGAAPAAETRFTRTFGSQIIDENKVAKIPPWFYLVMSVSGGINNAFISELPCTINIREMQIEASTAQINDIQLKGELNKFINDCYSTAKADYFYGNNTVTNEEDIAWIGSQYFLDNQYKKIWSNGPVKNWPVDMSREGDRSHFSTPTPLDNGYPYCNEWWDDSERGLRNRLLQHYPPSGLSKLATIFGDPRKTEDAAIRKLLQNNKHQTQELDLTNAPSFGEEEGISLNPLDTAADVAVGALQWGGGVVAAATVEFVTNMIVMSLPYVQALALFGVFFLLPLALVFGGYDWSVIKTASIYIFAINFWSSIWAVVAILDSELTTSMSVRDGVHPIDFISLNIGFAAIISSMAIAALYVALPSFLMLMLSWAGERGMSAGSEMSQSGTNAAKGAGSTGAGIAKGAASKMK
jgi:hypothetical protein